MKLEEKNKNVSDILSIDTVLRFYLIRYDYSGQPYFFKSFFLYKYIIKSVARKILIFNSHGAISSSQSGFERAQKFRICSSSQHNPKTENNFKDEMYYVNLNCLQYALSPNNIQIHLYSG